MRRMKPTTRPDSTPVDDPGRCAFTRPDGSRCKRRDLAWQHYTAAAKPTDPAGRLCCYHWQRAKASQTKRAG